MKVPVFTVELNEGHETRIHSLSHDTMTRALNSYVALLLTCQRTNGHHFLLRWRSLVIKEAVHPFPGCADRTVLFLFSKYGDIGVRGLLHAALEVWVLRDIGQ